MVNVTVYDLSFFIWKDTPGFAIGLYVLYPTVIFMAVMVPSYLLFHVDGACPIPNAWFVDMPSDATRIIAKPNMNRFLPR